MPKFFIFDAFTLFICEKTVANYALLRCKTFSLKIWLSKFLTNIMSAYKYEKVSRNTIIPIIDMTPLQYAGVCLQHVLNTPLYQHCLINEGRVAQYQLSST